MAAPVMLIPISATFASALAERRNTLLGESWWKVEIDDDEDGTFDDVTALLDANSVRVEGKGSRFEAMAASAASFSLRNVPKVYSEGALAKKPVRVWAKVGSESEYIRVFTGFVDPPGAKRRYAEPTQDVVTFECHDPSQQRAINRTAKTPTLYVSHKICDPAGTGTSLVHKFATQLGLSTSDLDVYAINYTKPYSFLNRKDSLWKELQAIAQQYTGLLGYRYDGKLRLAVWSEADWNAGPTEYTFDDTNSHAPIDAPGSNVVCNSAYTEFETYQIASFGAADGGAKQIFKCYDRLNEDTKKNEIELVSGDYYPVAADENAVLVCNYERGGEKFPIGVDIATPTIGLTGSGADIQYDGPGTLVLISFNGVAGSDTSKTTQEVGASQLILQATGGNVTITRIRLRGTAVRVLSKMKVVFKQAGLEDYELIEKPVNGKYAVSYAQAEVGLQCLVDYGAVARRRYEFDADFTPHLQAGAVVTYNPRPDISILGVVESYVHSSSGPHTKTRTHVILTEHSTFTSTPNGAQQQYLSMPQPPQIAGSYARVNAYDDDSQAEYYCTTNDDNQDIINAAILAQSNKGGGEVRLNGTYYVSSSIEMQPGVRLKMTPTTRIVPTADTNFRLISAVGTADAYLEHIEINGGILDCQTETYPSVGALVGLYVRDFRVFNSILENCNSAGGVFVNYGEDIRVSDIVSTNPGAVAVLVTNSTRGLITRVSISGVSTTALAYGVNVGSCTAFNVDKISINGLVASHDFAGVTIGAGSSCRVQGCTIENIRSGVEDTSNTYQCIGVLVTGDHCVVENNTVKSLKHFGQFLVANGFAWSAFVNRGEYNRFANNVHRETSNLIDNGSCEDSAPAPRLRGQAGVNLINATFAQSSDHALTGTYSFKLTKTVAAGTAGYVNLHDHAAASDGDMADLLTEHTYKLGVWIKIPAASGVLGTEVRLSIDDNVQASLAVYAENVYDEWQYVEGEYTFDKDAEGITMRIVLDSAAALNEYIYVDELDLQDMTVGDNSHLQAFDGNDTEAVGVRLESNSWEDAA